MSQTTLGNRLLGRLDPGDRAILDPHLTPVSFRSGHVFFEPQTEITHLYFLEEGAISAVVTLDSGVCIEALLVGREGVVGCLAAFEPCQSYARAIAQIPGRALKVEAKAFRAVIGRSLTLARIVDRHRNHVHSDLAQSVACNTVHRVRPRLAKWLLRCHDRVDGDRLPLTQEMMGQMIGSQRTTVTELAGDLQRAGLIRYQRGALEILDRVGLERAACECYAVVRARELALA
ncbi:MAG: Crp/Fnr family transcriptional regulator [Proteobacteria bacterium]|nr:Crp/Fnr family transcriptional regulator [Pseudomonadota bacterium]